MINKDFFAALEDLERERKINKDVFIESLEAGLVSAYKRDSGEARNITVRLNPVKGEIKVFAYKIVSEEIEDPDKQITLDEAREIKKAYKIGDWVLDDVTPKDLSRIAIQTAKQVITQRLGDVRKEQIMQDVTEREGEIASARITKIDGDSVYVEISANQIEGVMGAQDRVPTETYEIARTIKVYVKNTRNTPRGPQAVVSRSVPQFVKRLFELEVPEIKSGDVIIKGVVRDAGYRTKMAVYSENPNIDAVGSCIGQKGARINAVVNELNGEKVDIIPWCEDPLEYVARALSPAKVMMVQVEEDNKSARVVVPDDKLSLAIGKGGQNVRLAAKLTGWKIDVKAYSQIVNINDLDVEPEDENLDN